MPLDYSKWDHIEVSDDEDDTHPNIDTPSLFKWRHEARIERDAQWNKEKESYSKEYADHLKKYNEMERKFEEAKKNKSSNLKDLETEFNKLKTEDEEWKKKSEDIKKKERLRPWNIDTICKEGKSYTAINHIAPKPDEEEDVAERLKTFIEKHEKEIKKYGMFQKPVDSRDYLCKNPHLVCEDTANHLVLWCIELAVEEKFDLMNHVSHQCIVMQFLLELAKSRNVDPRVVVRPFFDKFLDPNPEYHQAFQAELDAFRIRIRDRAKVRIQEAMDSYEEEERQKRLGPGGLDPYEVIETLPEELRSCFEKRDTELLKEVIMKMSPEDASYHMKRCVDSGLWLDNANEEEGEAPEIKELTEKEENEEKEKQKDEKVVSEPTPSGEGN